MGLKTGKHRPADTENKGPTIWDRSIHRASATEAALSRPRKYLDEKKNTAPSSRPTTLYGLPLEMLDVILQKSYLHWALNSSMEQRDEEVVRSLASVDIFFCQSITRKRSKRAIWRCLKDFYERSKKHSAICRNNKEFLLKNIQPNAEFIDALFSLNCITGKKRHFIKRQNSTRDKNRELLYAVNSFDEKKFSDFAKCLRQTNQTEVAKIIVNGGVVIEVEIQNSGRLCAESMDKHLIHQRLTRLLASQRDWDFRTLVKEMDIARHEDILILNKQPIHQKLSDPRFRISPRSWQKDEDIAILDTQVVRRTVVVLIWCRSQAAVEHIHRLHESSLLKYIFHRVFLTLRSIVGLTSIDSNQFMKTVVGQLN
jgi:hypothetical protein